MNKKENMITTIRAICLVIVLAILYRNSAIEIFLTAVAVAIVTFWVLPHLLTSLIFIAFKLKDEYGGTLLFDDSDITNCKFRMIFNFEPEELAKEPTFIVNCERANLREQNKD